MDADSPAPQLDKEARIAQRRARIEARLEAKKGGEGEDSKLRRKKQEEKKKEVSRSKSQIAESRTHLDKIKTSGTNEVTKIRVTGDNRENERRINEEVNRQARRQKLLYEAESSARQNAAVAMKWSALFEKEIPQELEQEIRLQQDTCERIIQSKDRLIKEFKAELKAKDDEYVKALKKQAEDIDLLLERMGKQFQTLRKAYEDELEEIENAFMQERQELIDSNKNEIASLMDKRQQKEVQYMDARQQRAEEDQRQLEAQRVQDAEDYNILKIKLETEIQTLEQQLEEMRATYQLNSEKLEYNYRVLMERDIENSNTINQQKRKLARLQDVLSSLKAKYAKEDRRFKQENQELTEEYKRITEQFKDLQNKFRHFEIADTKRYRDVWHMNEETVTDLMRKVLQADKIIHEQQLGLNWYPPSEEIFQAGYDPAAHADRAAPTAGTTEGDANGGPISRGQMDNENIKRMLELLCNEAGFLVEGKIQKLLDPLPIDEQNLLKIDSILKVLGVESAPDVEKLLSYFLADADNHELIHPNDAIKAIKAFVEDHQRRPDSLKTAKHTVAKADERAEGTRREEREFWERMASIIGDKTFRVWNALEKALQKYNELLTNRTTLIGDVSDLQRQNEELKALLNQYLSSKINEDLHVPPTQVIRLDNYESFQQPKG